MNCKFFPYDSFDYKAIKDESETATIVYDRKPTTVNSEFLFDLNHFKFLTWKNEIPELIQNKVIFLVKKISDDFLYSFFRHSYNSVEFYTDEPQERVFPKFITPNFKIVFYSGISTDNELIKNELIKNESIKNESIKNESIKNESIKNESIKNELIKDELIKDELIKDELIKDEFIKLFGYFLEFNRKFIEIYKSMDTAVVLANDDIINKFSFRSARTVSDRKDLSCIVYNFDPKFDCSGFKEIYYLIPDEYKKIRTFIEQANNKFEELNITEENRNDTTKSSNISNSIHNLSNNSCDKVNNAIHNLSNSNCDKVNKTLINPISSAHSENFNVYFNKFKDLSQFSDNFHFSLISLDNFLFYVNSIESDIYNILDSNSLNISYYPIAKYKEIQIGSVVFPIEYSRQFMEYIMYLMKNVFESNYLYIKTLLPKIVYAKGGFYNQEFYAKMYYPNLFDFTITSDCFISKKEATNDMSIKFIQKLVEIGILNSNFDINSENLMNYQCIKKLLQNVYGSTDNKQIGKMKNELLCEINYLNIKESIVEQNGKIRIIQSKLNRGLDDIFKRKYMIDILEGVNSNTNTEERSSIGNNITKEINITKENNIKEDTNHEITNQKSSNEKDTHLSNNSDFLNPFNFFNNSPISVLEKKYRKIPSCLSANTNVLALYTFSNSSTGVLCSDSPMENCEITNEINQKIQINYTPSRIFTKEELHLLKFYQVIFFKSHIELVQQKKQTFKLFYYAVPLNDKKEIDWNYLNEIGGNFLQNFVYSEFDTDNENDIIDYRTYEKMNNVNIDNVNIDNANYCANDMNNANNSLAHDSLVSINNSPSLFNNSPSLFNNSPALFNNLIWNPFTKEFLIFHSVLDQSIENEINGIPFVEFFQNKYNVKLDKTKGKYLFKAYNLEEVSSIIRKEVNQYFTKNSINTSAVNDFNNCGKVKFSICENKSEKICVGLNTQNFTVQKFSQTFTEQKSSQTFTEQKASQTFTDQKFSQTFADQKFSQTFTDQKSSQTFTDQKFSQNFPNFLNTLLDINVFSVFSSECCFTTPVLKSILVELEIFKRNYRLLEDIFISLELRQTFDLSLEPPAIIQSFSQSRDNGFCNYERLEFLGDCVLKFLTTSYLYLSGYPLERIVSFKDSVVCNANLFKYTLESGIFRYLKTASFNPKMVQPPNIEFSSAIKSYFTSTLQFNSDNYFHYSNKSGNSDSDSIKVYADMIEALIGSLFLNRNIEEAYKFICKLGILKNTKNESQAEDSVLTEQFLKSVFEQEGSYLKEQQTIKKVKDDIKSENGKDDRYENRNDYRYENRKDDRSENRKDGRSENRKDDRSENDLTGSNNYFTNTAINNFTNTATNFTNTSNSNNFTNATANSNNTSANINSHVIVNSHVFLPNFPAKITDPNSVFCGYNFTYFQFNGLINANEINAIENIIGYKFINPGNLERAVVHPSYTITVGFEDFQYLELIGDCALDLFVNVLLYDNISLNTPLLLHSAKKSYVNNNSLRALFYKFGFEKYTKLQILNMPNSKAFSDVIEAIIGAIMIDLQWNFKVFSEVMNVKFKKMIEESRSEFNYD